MDQDVVMDEISNKIKNAGLNMRKALETADLKKGLKFANSLLMELKTNSVTPRNYYNLYMQAFNELKLLEQAFLEEQRKGRKMGDIYESVQYAENILPRLYLMITVGSAFIQSKEIQTKELLKDLIGMVKGVQHPMRGLFLRYYLLKMMKDYLPDSPASEQQTPAQDGAPVDASSDVDISVGFILQNLKEMNLLWIRMAHQGNKNKEKREIERNELRVTVGENIIRMSNLEGINRNKYVTTVFPLLIDIIKECNDVVSQQYLMDCVISAFPDDYHLYTLAPLMTGCELLQPTVDLKAIFINLLNRLSQYFSSNKAANKEILEKIDVFDLFRQACSKVIDNQGASDFKKLLEMELAFMKFVIKTYPMNLVYVNTILEQCVRIVDLQGKKSFENDSLKLVTQMLITPLESLSLKILELNQYPKMMQFLLPKMRKDVSIKILTSIINVRHKITSCEVMNKLIELIPTLLEDNPEIVEEQYEFEESQILMCKLVYMIETNSNEEHLQMISILKKLIKTDDLKRIKFQYPTIAFAYFKLLETIFKEGKGNGQAVEKEWVVEQLKKIFVDVLEMSGILKSPYPHLGLRILLYGILAYGKVGYLEEYEDILYEYATSSVEIFEEDVTDSDTKCKVVNSIVAHMQFTTSFSTENYDTITRSLTKICSKLLKKQDQVKSMLACTHMFYSSKVKDIAFVQEIMKKCQRVCDNAKGMKKNVDTFAYLLQKQLYYYMLTDEITKVAEINSTISTIRSILSDKVAPDNELKILTSSYEQLKVMISSKLEKAQDQALKDRIKQIEL